MDAACLKIARFWGCIRGRSSERNGGWNGRRSTRVPKMGRCRGRARSVFDRTFCVQFGEIKVQVMTSIKWMGLVAAIGMVTVQAANAQPSKQATPEKAAEKTTECHAKTNAGHPRKCQPFFRTEKRSGKKSDERAEGKHGETADRRAKEEV